MQRRSFLEAIACGAAVGGAAGQAPASPSAARPGAFELDELTLADLAKGLAEGRWTSRSLVELYAARIQAVDRSGPRINAVLALNPDAPPIANRPSRRTQRMVVLRILGESFTLAP